MTNPLSSCTHTNNSSDNGKHDSLRKQSRPPFDSPGHTSVTSTVSSFDTEDPELTPRPLPERLGRIITDDDEEDEPNENYAAIAPPPRRPCMTRRTISAGSVQYDRWLRNDTALESFVTNTFLQEMQQLNRLASMDSDDYHAQLLDNSLPSLSSGKLFAAKEESQCASPPSSTSCLSLIPHQMVQLSMSIHRLHSVVTNLTQEVDGHTDDTRDLQAQLLASQERNQQLEKALHKLYQKNQKLKQNTEKERTVRRQLQKQVHDYEQQLEARNFELVASQVQQHELRLLQQKQRQHEELSSVASSGYRTDSPFSELCLEDIGMDVPPDEGEPTKDDSGSFVSGSSSSTRRPTLCFSAQGSLDSAIARVRTFSSSSVASISSGVGKAKSSLTENNVTKGDAEHKASNASEEPKNESLVDVSSDAKQEEATSSKEDKAEGKSKAQASKEDKPEGKSEAKPPLTGIMSSLNMNFGFLNTRQASGYTLRMSPPFTMQFAMLEVDAKDSHNEVIGKEKAFVVVGFRGFDDFTNVRPTLGARLMKINDTPISSKWTVDDVTKELYGKKASKTLSFRNDDWDAAQKKELNAVIARNNAAAMTGVKPSAIAETDSGKKEDQIAISEQPPLRSRAGSAEAVGKVIGNLFSNRQHRNISNSDESKR
jgi:hypothetical protein